MHFDPGQFFGVFFISTPKVFRMDVIVLELVGECASVGSDKLHLKKNLRGRPVKMKLKVAGHLQVYFAIQEYDYI